MRALLFILFAISAGQRVRGAKVQPQSVDLGDGGAGLNHRGDARREERNVAIRFGEIATLEDPVDRHRRDRRLVDDERRAELHGALLQRVPVDLGQPRSPHVVVSVGSSEKGREVLVEQLDRERASASDREIVGLVVAAERHAGIDALIGEVKFAQAP